MVAIPSEPGQRGLRRRVWEATFRPPRPDVVMVASNAVLVLSGVYKRLTFRWK
jgi:hypothetical protein